MKLTHLMAGIAVAAGLVYGGLKTYTHHQIKSTINDTLDKARPFVDIKYRSLSTDLSGSATLTGISISPNGFPEIFMIDTLALRGPNLAFLINGFKNTAQHGEFPAQVELDMRGLHLRTDGHLLETMHKSMQEVGKLLQIESDGCGMGSMFGYEDFAALGYTEIIMNMRMGYRFADSFPGIEIMFDFSVGDESVKFTSTLTDISRSLADAQGAMPRLRDIKLQYQLDPVMTRKAVAYCAEKRGVDNDTYLTQLMQEPDESYMLSLGFVPGPGLRNAMHDMLRNPGEMLIEAHPSEPLDITQLALYSTVQMPDLLALTMTVNGQAVEDLSMSSLDLSERIDPAALRALQDGDVWLEQFGIKHPEPAQSPTETPITPGETGQYTVIDNNKLGEYLGRPVRILASGGRKRSGRLLKLDRGIATIEERIHGGTLTTSVALRDIRNVEVQF